MPHDRHHEGPETLQDYEGAAIAAAQRAQYPDMLARDTHHRTAFEVRKMAAATAETLARRGDEADPGVIWRRSAWSRLNVFSHRAIAYIEHPKQHFTGTFQTDLTDCLGTLRVEGDAARQSMQRDWNEMARMLRETQVARADEAH